MEEIAVSISKDGEVTCIYNEDIGLAEMGDLSINRLSDVEFNNDSRLWEVRHKGEVLSTHKTRQEGIDWEIKYFNDRILQGKL